MNKDSIPLTTVKTFIEAMDLDPSRCSRIVIDPGCITVTYSRHNAEGKIFYDPMTDRAAMDMIRISVPYE